ncbi:MAG: hypothetical protein AAB567_01365 [Patescibacteria group bacterium]
MDISFLNPLLAFVWGFLKTWWWIFPPFFLFRPFIYFWLYWRSDLFDARTPRITLEIKMPQNVEKPLKAMESVFSGFWQIYDPPNPREKWLEGQYQLGFAIEIVSVEGQVHFYLRIPKSQRKLFESAVYSQYPDAELQEVEDYTKAIPQNIPNKDWRMWGASYKLNNPSCYPIKTYSKFFEVSPDTKEEKRVDPIAILVEGLSRLGEGEHMWIHFLMTPFSPVDEAGKPYVAQGRKIVDKLVRRPEPVKPSTVWQDLGSVGSVLVTGKAPEVPQAQQQQEIIPPEMKLTPGEREIVSGIEEKLSKPSFDTVLRFVYIARTDKYDSSAKALAMSYFQQFSTAHANFLRPLETTKVHTILTFPLDRRRGYVRRRRLFVRHINRLGPYWPAFGGGSFVLNIEELASMFHFPSKITFPSGAAPRVEVRKGQAPAGLPVQEE